MERAGASSGHPAGPWYLWLRDLKQNPVVARCSDSNTTSGIRPAWRRT